MTHRTVEAEACKLETCRHRDSLLLPLTLSQPATLSAATRPLFRIARLTLQRPSSAGPRPNSKAQPGLGAQPLLTLGVPPSGGAGIYRKLTFLCKRLAWRGTPASRAHPRRRKLGQGQPWARTHPPCPAAAVPRAPRADPVPMAGPYFILPSPGGKCGRAPWGRQPPAAPRQAGSERATRAPPAQPCAQGRRSRRTARPQPRGRPRQAHGPRSPAAALAPASLFLLPPKRKKQEKAEREIERDDQTFGGGPLAVPGGKARPGESARRAVEAASPPAWGRRGKGRIWGK